MRNRHLFLLAFSSMLAESQVHSSPTQRQDPLFVADNPSLPAKGVVFSKDIRMRDNPSTTKTDVVDVLPFGTTVTIVERHPEKVDIMNYNGHWYKVVTASGKSGWIFEKFLASEKSEELLSQANAIVSNLYYARPQLRVVLEKIRTTPSSEIQTALQRVRPEAYNYLAYHLLLERNPNAFPVLLEYMNPAWKSNHERDPNYQYNWEILSRMIPNEMILASYQSYLTYWKEKGASYQFPLSYAELFQILVRIKTAEDRALRSAAN